MKIKLCILSVLLTVSQPCWGALYEYGTLAGGSAIGTIPDNNVIGTSGLSGTYFTASGLGLSVSALTLTFVLQGGDSSDLSGYLRLGSTDYFDLTTVIRGQTLSAGSPITYTLDFSNTGFQSAFDGQNPNNTWTLYFADAVNGDATTLNGWSLNITDISAVPEPVNIALGIFGGLVVIGSVRRRLRQRST
jgi:hypothetical protein